MPPGNAKRRALLALPLLAVISSSNARVWHGSVWTHTARVVVAPESHVSAQQRPLLAGAGDEKLRRGSGSFGHKQRTRDQDSHRSRAGRLYTNDRLSSTCRRVAVSGGRVFVLFVFVSVRLSSRRIAELFGSCLAARRGCLCQ